MTHILRPGTGSPRLLVAAGPHALSATAADLFVATTAGAIGERGVAHVALTGGSSAMGLYRALREPSRVDAVDWSRVHLWFGDDRVVPLDHADSNAGLAHRELLGPGGAAVPHANVHAMLAGVDTTAADAADVAARRYEAELGIVPADDQGVPILDLLLLGMGPDGHVLSVFPGSEALSPAAPTVLAIPAPTHIKPELPRVTLHPAVIEAARSVLLTVSGAAKATVVFDVLEGDTGIEAHPARLARIDTATWLLDPSCAVGLVIA